MSWYRKMRYHTRRILAVLYRPHLPSRVSRFFPASLTASSKGNPVVFAQFLRVKIADELALGMVNSLYDWNS